MARLFPTLSILSVLLLVGCASHGDRLRPIRAAYYGGDVGTARKELDEQIKRNKQRDADVLKLDRAIIDLCSGKAEEAESTLREVRDRFDALEQKSAAEGIASMLSDDNAAAYAGEDYEKVMIRVFLAIANLMHDGGDAAAYSLQVGMKQDEIVRNAAKHRNPSNPEEEVNPKLAYKRVPIGPYLYGAMQEATHTNYDEAKRAYTTVCDWYPEFQQGKTDLHRATHGVHAKPENGVVHVIALVGQGPYKEQQNAEVTQASLFIATMLINMLGSQSVTPGIAPVLIPVVVMPLNEIDRIRVATDLPAVGLSQPIFTETITDIGKMAREQYAAVEAQTIARAVVRRVVKKGVLYGIKEATDVNPYVSLAMDVGGMIWEGRETADTRCWGLLPETIQVLRLELPAGDRTITLEPCGPNRNAIGRRVVQTVRVEAGRNTYLLANFPGAECTGVVQNR